MRGNENPEHIAEARETALAFVGGHKVDEIVRLGEEIFDEVMADRIWPGTRALAQSHLDAGQRVWLVTATPVELARVIAQRLGPDRRARHRRRDHATASTPAGWSATCCTARPRPRRSGRWPRARAST